MPTQDALDTTGLDITKAQVETLLSVNKEDWKKEVESIKKHYETYGKKLPSELKKQLEALESRLNQ
ncbi:Phosphoenolpyruvate carboxykinase [GTP] [bioreactor metagenome]|uniref:Phosphoenolpyruvate carboxykinase [GTP] n=1 Tax=bioreactor metagenome TaxID=1076179 RepID=A0A645JM66_9ZZZZ